MMKKWRVRSPKLTPVENISELKESLLAQRGVALGDEESFFQPKWGRDVHDPMLMRGMDRAVQRIFSAIEKGEQILIYGDYDVDGITSVIILGETLRLLGGKVTPFLPHRIENGYGLDQSVLKNIAKEIELLITVDCGISNRQEVAWLKNEGIDVIITDHHEIPETLPLADAVIHPRHPEGKYPFGGLSGAGVSYKLSQALLRKGTLPANEALEQEIRLLDLVSLGTVADMMPMKGENRALVVFGLGVLARTTRPGIQAILEAEGAGQTINESYLGFKIAPLLNAAGRLDHPQAAMDLLMSHTDQEAKCHLAGLKKLNRQRQLWSQKIIAEVEAAVKAEEPIVFAHNSTWPAGVVGLAAGRLSDKYSRPAFIMGKGKEALTGSARAPKGGNLVGLLEQCEDCLIKYGGHAAAAGYSVSADKLELLKERLAAAVGTGTGEKLERETDAILAPALISRQVTDLTSQMRPFGAENEEPVFIGRNLDLADWRVVGRSGEHIKFAFNVNGDLVDGIGFSMLEDMKGSRIAGGEPVDAVFKLEIDSYRGREKLQLKVEDIARAGEAEVSHHRKITYPSPVP